ncbi:DUF6221 family protein [Glycomyces paridis]|uniref:Uncharacterized protein n=1 Tax=Glycomyces paridis TaxID=2126555 RepID=A0A4S8PC78_9ACTN|nr:DUF6221 family protein [Glycomyces paridis]THV27928.1 hypothetical protein E9998_13130 [Glycomyces paridis]
MTDQLNRTDALKAFVDARIDQDEATAREASQAIGDGIWAARARQVRSAHRALVADTVAERHIARHDPRRVLLQAAALRAILAAHSLTDHVVDYGSGTEDLGCVTCHDWDGVTVGHGYCDTLLALAAIWEDDPHWDTAWCTHRETIEVDTTGSQTDSFFLHHSYRARAYAQQCTLCGHVSTSTARTEDA